MSSHHPTSAARSRDYSGAGILAGNVLAIVFALIEGWGVGALMGIYWAQSVIIGIFHFFRILLLRSFCTEGFTSNGKPVPESGKGKLSTAIFFAFHYGFFHFVYGVFLVGLLARGVDPSDEVNPNPQDEGGSSWIYLSVLGFLLGHAFSFYRNVRADLANKPNLGTMMFLPYVRIVPMHLTILLGGQVVSGTSTILLFSGLKTVADYIMHVVEHRVLQKGPPAGGGGRAD